MSQSAKSKDLIDECKRQVDNCLYTSTSLFIWLRRRRQVKTVFIVTPIVLGSFATWELVTRSDSPWLQFGAAFAAFISGLMPLVYSALKYDDDLEKCKFVAAEFKNLQDRFRQVAVISSKKSFKEFESDFSAVMDRMEKARQESLTPPEWCFKEAQEKVKSGDYTFDVDLSNDSEKNEPNPPGLDAPG